MISTIIFLLKTTPQPQQHSKTMPDVYVHVIGQSIFLIHEIYDWFIKVVVSFILVLINALIN